MPRFLLALAVLAVVVFFVVSMLQRRGGSPPRALGRRPGPTAPDDDPQFLRDLDDRLWRDRRRRREQDGPAGKDEPGAA